MNSDLKYCIVYAGIRPEIGEKLSVGIFVIKDEEVVMRYSQKKLDVLKQLYSKKEYDMISKIVRSEMRNIDSLDKLGYLTRYSNNMITLSPIMSIDNSQSDIDTNWLYATYVYNSQVV